MYTISKDKNIRESIDSTITETSNLRSLSSEQKILVDKKLYNKLVKFVNQVSTINTNTRKKLENELKDNYTQTDIENDETEIIDKLKIENENYLDNNRILKVLCEEMKEEIQIMRNKINELEEKNKNLNVDLENINNELINKRDKIHLQEKVIDNLNKDIKKILTLKNNFDNKEDLRNDNNYGIMNQKILNNIMNYLSPKDLLILINASKNIDHIIRNDKRIIFPLIRTVVDSKNEIINKLNERDFNKEYEISDKELERLMKDYVLYKKTPGKDLVINISKCSSYLEKEIKKPLGLPYQEDKRKSIIGNLINVFNKSIKKLEYENINEYERSSDLSFDFENPEEIKNLLFKFFTANVNGVTISNFISELIKQYSDLLYYSYRTLNEIKELDIVKNAINERFRKYHKICIELENELEDLKKFSKTNKEIKDILMKQKLDIEVKYSDSLTQISYLKDDNNKISNKLMTTTEKYHKIENEFEIFKNKLVKEFKLLKLDYDNIKNEREILLEALYEFKRYFLKFEIDDDGNIKYTEN